MEQLSGLDAAFVYAETAGAAHVTFFAIYDPSSAPGGTVTMDDVIAHMGSRLGTDRVFRSVLARVPFDLDHPYWVRDEKFDLTRHIHRVTLPRPGGWLQLCQPAKNVAESVERHQEQPADALHRPGQVAAKHQAPAPAVRLTTHVGAPVFRGYSPSPRPVRR